jgi:hypothetical protein
MIDRAYRCDLCRDIHDPNVDAFYGIYWEGNRQLVERPVRTVEHHLCLKCIQDVAALFEKIRLPDSAEGKS